jgi:hypothetical protein
LLHVDEITEQSEIAELNVTLSIVEECVKMMEINDLHRGDSLDGFVIFQEGQIIDNATGDKNESIIKKALLLIPRLIAAIFKAIKTKLTGKGTSADVNRRSAFVRYGEITRKGLSDKEVEDVKKRKQKSPIYKAIVASGCVGLATAGAEFAFRIADYSEAVEFKDDVSFVIAEDLTKIRIMFPFYKIEDITKFNDKFNSLYQSLQADFYGNLKELVNLMKTVVTNQARVSERDFANPPAWTDYYQNTIKRQFAIFSDNLEKIKGLLDEHAIKRNYIAIEDIPMKEFFKRMDELTRKLPNDLELIEKFNDKLIKVYDILANPSEHSKRELKKAGRFTFKPVFSKDEINIYNIDTTHLSNAIKMFNEFAADAGFEPNPESENKDLGEYIKSLIQPEKVREVLNEIEKQFNCKIEFIERKNVGGATLVHKNKAGEMNITFNKQRGFDLGGAKIMLITDTLFPIESAPKGIAGQMFCSIICHEIFHNIANLINIYNSKIYNAIFKALSTAMGAVNTVKALIQAILGIYTLTLGLSFKDDEKTNKRFAYVIANFDNKQKMTDFVNKIKNNDDESLLENIDVDGNEAYSKLDAFAYNLSAFMQSSEFSIVKSAIFAILCRYNFILGGMYAISTLYISIYGIKNINMEKTNEETMCDMCAAIYKLPVHLQDVSKLRENKSMRNLLSNKFDVHSATFDRQTVSLGLAKEILNSGEQLDPEVKKYLEFIVEENEGNQYAERKFTKKQMKKSAPAFTKNINRAITNFVKDHNIPITDEGEKS